MTTNFEYYPKEEYDASSATMNDETKQLIARFRQRKLSKLALDLSLH